MMSKHHCAIYIRNVVFLWVDKKISWRTAFHGIRHFPIALAGRKGSYIVDPTFEP